MKLAILTDIHFGARSDSPFILDTQEQFYSEVFFPECKARGIDHLLLLGDTFENRKSVNILTLHRSRKMFFDKLLAEGFSVTAILGNHDVYYRHDNSVNIMSHIADMYPNINLIQGNGVITLGDLNIGLVSWINRSNYEDAKKFISGLENVPILCGHFEINGFDMTPGRPCEGGMPREMFDKFERVLSGHFHCITDDGKIKYISNNTQTNWSDLHEKKGFHVLDTLTRDLTHIVNPNDVFLRVEYNMLPDPVAFDVESHCKGKIVRVAIPSFLEVNHDALSIFVDRVAGVAHSVETIETSILVKDIDSDMVVERQEGDLSDIIRTYVDETVDSDAIDKNRLKMMLDELLTDARQMIGDDV